MSIRLVRVMIVLAPCLAGLGGCSSSAQLSDLWARKGSDASAASATDAADSTGSVTVTPAEPGPSGEPVAPLAKPGHLGDDPHDDLQLAKKYFRSNNYALAEKAYRTAVETHPRDAEAWVGLAACYDRLRRFDLADRAYQEAIRIIGPTVEILNNQGFSYMLRGDYARAKKLLEQAQARTRPTPTSRPICSSSTTASTTARRCSRLILPRANGGCVGWAKSLTRQSRVGTAPCDFAHAFALRKAVPPYRLTPSCPRLSRPTTDDDVSGRHHADARRRARARLSADDDLDIAVERGEEGHQTFDRKPFELVIAQRRNLRLIDIEPRGGGVLRQSPLGDDGVDRVGEPQLGLPLFGVFESQICKYIAAAASNRGRPIFANRLPWHNVPHSPAARPCCFTDISRILLR